MGDSQGNDGYLGGAAQLLRAQGRTQAAALLLDAINIDFVYRDTLYRIGGGEERLEQVAGNLLLVGDVMDHATEDVIADIKDALNEVVFGDGLWVEELRTVPAPAEPEWRAPLQEQLLEKPRNQAVRAPLPKNWLERDGMRFRDVAEVEVYDALRRLQARLPDHDTLTIVPNPASALPKHVWEPDFLVLYRGRAGLIQVDGATHRGRWVQDRSKDRLFEDAGAALVDRIDASDAGDRTEADRFVERFLRRLGEKH